MGTVSGSDAAMKLLDVVRATLRTTFRPRCELRVPPFFLLDLRFVPKSTADYAECGYFGKAKFAVPGSAGRWPVVSGSLPETCKQSCLRIARSISASCRDEQAGSLCSPEPNALRPSHVCARAGVDLDRFAFLDEKRHVNGLAGFELCRLGNVTGSIATNAFR